MHSVADPEGLLLSLSLDKSVQAEDSSCLFSLFSCTFLSSHLTSSYTANCGTEILYSTVLPAGLRSARVKSLALSCFSPK